VRTTVAGILLAAGEGSRLGQPKALVELDGQTLAERGVSLLRAGGADPILVVTGAAPVQLAGTRTVHNPQWRTGMGSSLRAALLTLAAPEAVPYSEADSAPDSVAEAVRDSAPEAAPGSAPEASPEVGAVVVALADQPLVGAEAVARLIAAYRGGASVAVAAYDARPRNPVLLAREHWPEVIATAAGDSGARAFLRARADLVTLVECGDTGRPDDIDTPADLARVSAALTQPADVEIRRAGLADADQVGALTERAYREGGWGNESYWNQLRDGRARIEDAIVLVAAAGGVILGTVTVARPGSRFAHLARAGEAEVRMLAVDEAGRGRGIASLLMAACEALARDEGLAAVVLCTEPDMYAAHRLYQRRGYLRQPDRDWQADGVTLLVYRLSI
jgi:CTP:molybdopterin cytidylyltransferase MocA/ribosomal protein S18 acetylase RimI-like enzyme